VTRLMVLPHSLLSPTATIRILPLPSLTCGRDGEGEEEKHHVCRHRECPSQCMNHPKRV
jgi:hypothetical protein